MLVMSQPSRISALLELVLFDKTVEDARNSTDHSRWKDCSGKVCLWSSTSQILLKIGFSRLFTRFQLPLRFFYCARSTNSRRDVLTGENKFQRTLSAFLEMHYIPVLTI